MPIRRGVLVPCLLCLLIAGTAGCGGGGGSSGDVIPVYDIVTVGRPSPVLSDLGGHVPGLVAFSLAYTNGDHHASTLAVGAILEGAPGAGSNSFVLKLDDGDTGLNNPRDPVQMSATYIDLFGISLEYVIQGFDLNGPAQLPLADEIPDGGILVLTGFAFVTDGSNHHIRVLRITPFPDLGYIEVEYGDDSPDDDLYYASVSYVVVPSGPAPEGSERYEFDGPYEEPMSFLGGGSTDRRPGTAVLHGFRLRFRDGDRHLNDVKVDLGADPSRIFARLADGDVQAEDFVDGRVSYVLVSP